MSRGPWRARHWHRGPSRPFVLGHRGARRRAPENTLLAFDLAMDEGADGVELDVRLDGDGQVVVLHDDTLLRVTDGRDPRRAEDTGSRALAAVDLGEGQAPPPLAEVLAWARRRGARVNVELKKDVSRRLAFVVAVARLVGREPDAAERLILSSFDPGLVRAMAYLLPWVPVGQLVDGREPLPAWSLAARLGGMTAVHPHASAVTAESIRPFRDAGLPVNVWTVNEADEARRLAALGVDALISDVPGDVLAALGSR